MPRHAVGAISVEAEPNRAKPLTEFSLVVRVQVTPDRFESTIRQGIVLVIEGHQSWNIHDPVIHPSPFGPPWHALHEPLEEEVGAGHPIAVNFHPRSTRKEGPLGASRNRRAPEIRSVVQKGGLEEQSHPARIAGGERMFDRSAPTTASARLIAIS